jgi:hypothetical protein
MATPQPQHPTLVKTQEVAMVNTETATTPSILMIWRKAKLFWYYVDVPNRSPNKKFNFSKK